uniref:Peptidase S51 dipeptidase E n=1 Tax=Chromera velia CCMP2878 TaxID=1169474 RepID=A0A0G4FTA7_9ALVE|eukprot:Cvel_18655.t1-p1 / transcript=Cvel_18655.t1 / gene=Cvel_18655 / organism=Chromera_velia_CCMP2878 / gene_product=G2/mitotic-specific cyclin-1, putative / transcript_product=G2/mitotic-specific cyclin-1, putative / location=Cvel_scaffold1559:5971-7271(+) / protein_length=359 / sequence_SO=supercontig / SO=protein_coding / is_pseudo=false
MPRGVFGGSGSDALNQKEVCDEVIALTGKDASDVSVLYLGTATYDAEGAREKQTVRFREAGCEIVSLDIAETAPTFSAMRQSVSRADVVLVSGGNTLYAVDRWKSIGMDVLLREAMQRGVVLSGGSAGAVCWFDGAHSDSADPSTFKKNRTGTSSVGGMEGSGAEEAESEAVESWEYIRVDGLAFFPGLVCPHYDRRQSNGVLRADDFAGMVKVRGGENGLGIDHWAYIVLDGETYRVGAVPGKGGSQLEGGGFSEKGEGTPGVWHVSARPLSDSEVDEKVSVKREQLPRTGPASLLLRPAASIEKDPRVDIVRKLNPIPPVSEALQARELQATLGGASEVGDIQNIKSVGAFDILSKL